MLTPKSSLKLLAVAAVCAAVNGVFGAGRTLTLVSAGDAFFVQRFPAGFSIAPELKAWIACAEGRQGPIVFNGMEMLFSHGATHLFQLN